jgi:hypothetical protein
MLIGTRQVCGDFEAQKTRRFANIPASLKIPCLGDQATLVAINTVFAETEFAKQELSAYSRP